MSAPLTPREVACALPQLLRLAYAVRASSESQKAIDAAHTDAGMMAASAAFFATRKEFNAAADAVVAIITALESGDRPDFRQRVRDEHADLAANIDKLGAFVNSPAFKTVEPVEKGLLIDQYDVMVRYRAILRARIGHFPT